MYNLQHQTIQRRRPRKDFIVSDDASGRRRPQTLISKPSNGSEPPASRADEKNFQWSDDAALAWFGTVIDPLSPDLVLLSTANPDGEPLPLLSARFRSRFIAMT